MISVVVILLGFVYLAGCISIQGPADLEKLKGSSVQLRWTYSRSAGEKKNPTVGIVTLQQVKSGQPVTTNVAFAIAGTKNWGVYEPYKGRGWSISMSDTQVTFSMKAIDVDDDGTYKLSLTYDTGTTGNYNSGDDNVVVNVLVLPYFKRTSDYTEGTITVDEGKKLTLKCRPEGSPKPIKIVWLKNGVPLPLKKNSDDPDLVFEKVNRTDEGTYTCQASNKAGIALKMPSTKVDVKYKPVNTKFNFTSILVDGERGELKCSAEADPAAVYTIVGGSINQQGISSGIATIGRVAFSTLNNKEILCTPKNRLGDGPTAKLTLDVQVKPVVLDGYFKDKADAIHGKNFSIKCRATGKPSPSISWLRNAQRILNQPPSHTVKFDTDKGVYIAEAVLLLVPARRQIDNADFTCLAKNAYGDDTKSTKLTLLYLPEITTTFRNREIVINTRIELKCEAVGVPKVTYYVWRWRNGTKIQNKTDGTLIFDAIQPHQGEEISCAAGSWLGEGKKKYVHLFVRVPPRIIVPPARYVSVNISERLLLFCNASGVPKPVIRWSLNGKLLWDEGEILDRASVKSSDRGEYMCSASNGISPNATAVSKVTVFFRPEIVTNTAADTIKGAESGTRVQLVCAVVANPSATLEWLYYPSRLPVNVTTDRDVIKIETTSSETTKLTLKARIGAKYVCHAYNNRGNSSQLYEIRPQGEPEAPKLKEVRTSIYTENDDLSVVQAYIKWIPGYDGGGSVSYNIFYAKLGKDHQITNAIDASCNCYTIKDGLEANKDYSFFVQAKNEFGSSNHSNVVNVRTEAFYGEASAQRYDEGRIVKIDVLKRTEENITKLIVRYRELQGTYWTDRDMTYELINDIEMIIEQLDPEKNYEFRVLWYVGNKLQITRAGEVGVPPVSDGRGGSALTREEIIAIIAGVGGFLLIVILIMFLCLIRRRQKPKRDEAVVVMRRQPGSVTAEAVTRRSLIGSVEDDPFESAHYGSKEKKNGKIRDSYYLPGPDDLNTFSTEDNARPSANPAANNEAYQPYRFGDKPKYRNQESSSSEDESLPRSDKKRLPSDENLSFDPGYARVDDLMDRQSQDSEDGLRSRREPNPNDVYARVNKRNSNDRPETNSRGAPPPYRPRSTASQDGVRNLLPYPHDDDDDDEDDQLDLDDPAAVAYNDPLPPPMDVLPPSRSVPDNMWDHYPDDRDDDSTLERPKSSSRTSLPGRPYINVHGQLVRPGSSGRLSSSENVDDQKRLPEPEVPSGRSRQMDLENDESNLVSYLV